MRTSITRLVASAATIATVCALAACGSTGSSEATADKPVEITWWGWSTPPAEQAKDFMKSHPNIKVKFSNVGKALDQYNSLSNAIQANSGMPDLATIEYFALPQFVQTGKLVDLTQFGADKFDNDYTTGTWSSVNINGGVYALPTDSGPMAFYYNKEVFDKAGVDATQIKTWDQYYEAAKKIRATGSYITSDSGDAGFYESMIWQAGGHPYAVSEDGKNLTVNLTDDDGTKEFTDFWQKMIDEDLIDTKTVGWTDEWNKGLGDGSIASLLTGAWMPVNLKTGAPQASGKWRVTQMPTWKEGDTANAENGGSSVALMDTGDKAKMKAAWEFLEYMNHSEKGTKFANSLGNFPASKQVLESEEFLNATDDYFGGQQVNKEFATAADHVLPDWQFLPYAVYVRNVFTDTVGKAFDGSEKLSKGIGEWQKNISDYGVNQGFSVKN